MGRAVFPSRSGSSMTGSMINAHLRQVSQNEGFELDVTTHCFRYFVAQRVYEKGGALMPGRH
jgi:site-specific recombinase XerD